MMVRVVMRMVHCMHFHSDRDPRSFTDLSPVRICSADTCCKTHFPALCGPEIYHSLPVEVL